MHDSSAGENITASFNTAGQSAVFSSLVCKLPDPGDEVNHYNQQNRFLNPNCYSTIEEIVAIPIKF